MKSIKEQIEELSVFIANEDWEWFDASCTALRIDLQDIIDANSGIGKGAKRAMCNLERIDRIQDNLYKTNADYKSYTDQKNAEWEELMQFANE